MKQCAWRHRQCSTEVEIKFREVDSNIHTVTRVILYCWSEVILFSTNGTTIEGKKKPTTANVTPLPIIQWHKWNRSLFSDCKSRRHSITVHDLLRLECNLVFFLPGQLGIRQRWSHLLQLQPSDWIPSCLMYTISALSIYHWYKRFKILDDQFVTINS